MVFSIYKYNRIKFLNFASRSKTGRSKGCLMLQGKGMGRVRLYRNIDFQRSFYPVSFVVVRKEYDSFRSGTIILLLSLNGVLYYNLCSELLEIGDFIECGVNAFFRSGIIDRLQNVPLGFRINSLESIGKNKIIYLRAGGAGGLVIKKQGNFVVVKMMSGEERVFPSKSLATVGIVECSKWKEKLCKAGSSRHRGIRPKVRGVAKNPVDHPHGGGEGRSSGGRPSSSPWGDYAKGKSKGSVKKKSKFILYKKGLKK